MYPILLEFWKIKIYTYGLFVALGFILGSDFAAREAKRVGESPARILDITFWFVIAGILGARILFIFMNIGDYVSDPFRILKIWEGGLAWYGGVVGAFLAAYLYTKRRKMSFAKVLDVIAPGVALGLAIGRWGCFSAGCCYGKTSGLPWAVTFTDPSSLANLNTPLHPTQVYEAIGSFMIFAVLRGMKKRKLFDPKEDFWLIVFWALVRFYALGKGSALPLISSWDIVGIGGAVIFYYAVKMVAVKVGELLRWREFDGMIALIWFASYAALRFFLEYLRDVGGITGWWIEGILSTSHVVSILVIVTCIFIFRRNIVQQSHRLP
jgi:phosphatidylglycerol:prolipoprotein diacylglycerol transferase